MARFDFIATPLNGLRVVQRTTMADPRGFLSRFYCAEEFAIAGSRLPIAQINHTLTSKRGAVRGLHFQSAPHAEMKFVSCINGEIWDVAVDLRRDSPTFLQWHGEILSAANRRSMLLPEGFAHGFQALSDNCELIYLHSAAYHPESEGALNVSDPRLGISWPLTITEISDRDRKHKMIGQDFSGMTS